MHFKCKDCHRIIPRDFIASSKPHVCHGESKLSLNISHHKGEIGWSCSNCTAWLGKDRDFSYSLQRICPNCNTWLTLENLRPVTKTSMLPKEESLLIFPKPSKELKIKVNEKAEIGDIMKSAADHLISSEYRSYSFKYRNLWYVVAKFKEPTPNDETDNS